MGECEIMRRMVVNNLENYFIYIFMWDEGD